MIQPGESKRAPRLGRFRLDGWSVCQDEGTLSCEDRVVRLEPRVMDVLACLAAEPGAVVSKEDLLEIVWGGAFVEEGALAQAIHSLRKALGDDARQPRFIQTIPKRGYRLVASVDPEMDDPEPNAPEGGPPIEPPASSVGLAPALPPRWKMWLLAGAALLAVLAVLGLVRERVRRPQPLPQLVKETPPLTTPPDTGGRIVVLPFQNLKEPQDAYFAKGLTEEITKDLASLPALEVISRTSAMQYEKTDKSLPEIARELKVDYVLEGTVQWSKGSPGGPRVRITPRLVRAADDTQIWVDGFDREMKDMFAVESEISRKVIAQLGVVLSPEQKQALRAPPTENLEAYQAYLRGLELRNQPFFSSEHVRNAVAMFERATELDPRFAAAWAELSQTHSYLAFTADRSSARTALARKAMERAVVLDADLLSVRLARIYYEYRCKEDYDAALALLTVTVQRFPNDAEVLQTLGFVLRRKGKLRESVEVLRHSYTLNPQNFILVWAIGGSYRAMRNYEAADEHFSRATSLAPDQPMYWEERTLNWLSWKGDVSSAREILRKAPIPDDPSFLEVSFELDFYARNFEKGLSRLSAEALRHQNPVAKSRLMILAAIARERLGHHRKALVIAESTRVQLEDLVRRFPKEPYYPAFLAITLAQLGRAGEASALAEKVARDNRSDAFGGPDVVQFQALTEAIIGRRHAAIGRLSHLLGTSYRNAISINELRLNPIWDPLRSDPEFEHLIQIQKPGD